MIKKLKNRFKHDKIIILQSAASGKSLRIMNDGTVNGHGGHGKFAQFKVHKTHKGQVKLQNVKNPNHWLRIKKDGQLCGLGKGGGLCLFHTVKHPNGAISLKGNKFEGHVGIKPDGSAKPAGKTGTGKHGRFFVHKLN